MLAVCKQTVSALRQLEALMYVQSLGDMHYISEYGTVGVRISEVECRMQLGSTMDPKSLV